MTLAIIAQTAAENENRPCLIAATAPEIYPEPNGCITMNYTVRQDEMERKKVMKTGESNAAVVSALRARAHFGNLLRRIEQEQRSVVIEKRGVPKAVLLSIRDYVRLAAPEPEVLTALGRESHERGTDRLTSRQIDRVIQSVRERKKRAR